MNWNKFTDSREVKCENCKGQCVSNILSYGNGKRTMMVCAKCFKDWEFVTVEWTDV